MCNNVNRLYKNPIYLQQAMNLLKSVKAKGNYSNFKSIRLMQGARST